MMQIFRMLFQEHMIRYSTLIRLKYKPKNFLCLFQPTIPIYVPWAFWFNINVFVSYEILQFCPPMIQRKVSLEYTFAEIQLYFVEYLFLPCVFHLYQHDFFHFFSILLWEVGRWLNECFKHVKINLTFLITLVDTSIDLPQCNFNTNNFQCFIFYVKFNFKNKNYYNYMK